MLYIFHISVYQTIINEPNKMQLQTFITKMPKNHHQHRAKKELGNSLTHSCLTHSTFSSMVFSGFLLSAGLQFLLS